MSDKSKDIFVLGDPHAHPDYDNDRFEAAGRAAARSRAGTIVCVGDWGDYPSLCKHSTQKEQEGKRLRRDIDAHLDSLVRFEDGLRGERRSIRKGKHPRKIYLGGNHEARIGMLESEAPSLEGELGAKEVTDAFRTAGWEVYPFKQIVKVSGVAFCHYFPSGNMGRAVGGMNLARSLLNKGYMSAVCGHDHRFDYAEAVRWDGAKIHAFNSGCFAHPDYIEPWCQQTEPMWNRGVLVLKGVDNGTIKGYSWTNQEELL